MSQPNTGASLPAGYSPPFAVVTEENHSAWIIIATALGLACVLVFVSARVVVRASMTSSMGKDDLLLASSLIMAIVQSAVVLSGCSVGLGESMTHMSSHQQIQIQKINYASKLLWIISLGLSKVSVASLIRRIDAFGRRSKVFDITSICLGAWTIASFFALALQCNLSHPWVTLNKKCTNMFLRWEVICAFDIITELLLFASAIYLVWEVQTDFDRKATIISGFACRLPIVIPIAFRLATYDENGLSEDPSLREALFIVWTQTELNYSIISATIPSLLHFMRNLNTTFGGLKDHGSTSHSSRQRSQHTFPRSLLRSKNKTEVSQKSQGVGDEEELTEFKSHRAAVSANSDLNAKGSKGSMGSSDSQRMIIQKAVEYTVQYE